MVSTLLQGGMAEWLKAAVLKTVVRKYRGFESYSLRQYTNCQNHFRRDDRVGRWCSPAKRVWGLYSTEGSNPSLSATDKGWLALPTSLFLLLNLRQTAAYRYSGTIPATTRASTGRDLSSLRQRPSSRPSVVTSLYHTPFVFATAIDVKCKNSGGDVAIP